ncbi:hypothetical protein AURDEDRAFT_167495 [Auricularia subglabra TFB-10046 SS5]|nr:hypothetical protein AURDEDRAFT_167495 [Auricularia subglabra TFB-10046 SS5]
MPIETLPDEILDHILDYAPLGLSDIVRASHVSARWRRIAHAHKTFCRNIAFEYNGDMAHESELCERLRKQMGCSQTPLHLTIHYFGNSKPVLRTVVSVLNDNMHRAVSLSLSLLARQTYHLSAALNRPAPQLRWLRVRVSGRHLSTGSGSFKQQSSHIPPAIFEGQIGLERLILTHVTFPGDPGTSLQSINHLALHNYSGAPEVRRALAACPRLRQLDLSVRWGAVPDAAHHVALENIMSIPALQQLHHLRLIMPLHIQTSYAYVLPHLGESLQVKLSDPSLQREVPHDFDLTFTDRYTGRVRRLGPHGIADLAEISRHIVEVAFTARIVELAVWVKLLYISGEIFPSLPSLETYTIHLRAENYSEVVYRPQARICAVTPEDYNPVLHEMPPCPSLNKIVVCGEGQRCPADWLARVLETLFFCKNNGTLWGTPSLT